MAHVAEDYDALKAFVGAHGNADDEFLDACWHEAEALVDNFVGGATVPATVLTRAYIETGSELYHRRQAPNGIAQYATLEGAPVRIARDPMNGTYPILRPFLPIGFA